MANVLTPVIAGDATDNRAKEESKHSSPLSENESNCGAIASRFPNMTRRYFTKPADRSWFLQCTTMAPRSSASPSIATAGSTRRRVDGWRMLAYTRRRAPAYQQFRSRFD
jgi:hypothetical protein